MEIEICAVSGYEQVTKNMTAIRINDEVIILDMGIDISVLAQQESEEGNIRILSTQQLINIGAVPDDNKISDWKNKVKAIILGHCHLDHISSVPFLAAKYKAPIIGTPYTIEVLKETLRDDQVPLPNKFIKMNLDTKRKISDNITVELIRVTHSTLQCAIIAVHTKEGILLYGNDFKFDENPVFGPKTNYKRLKELGEGGKVISLVIESMYANRPGHTPDEGKAKDLLKEVILDEDHKGKAIFITMFSSHITRIKTAIEIGEKLKRKVAILGRSMAKYIEAAERTGLVHISKNVHMCKYGSHRRKMLKQIDIERDKYIVICTGGQGEPGSILDEIVNNQLPFTFKDGDRVIFSCSTIPQPINIANRERLEKILEAEKVKIYRNVHVSVLPNTQVVINNNETMKIKEIQEIDKNEKIKVPAFDSNAKIKWYDARLIKHQYSGKIFNIKTKSGRSVSVTEGHSLFRLKNGNVQSIKSDNLKLNDYLAIPKRFSWRKELKEIDIISYITKDKYNPINYDKNWIYYGKEKICPRRIKLDNNFAKLLGYYLAEGSAPRHLSLVFGAHEEEVIKEFLKSAKKILPSNFVINNRNNATEITFGARILSRIFKKWFGDNARNKKIPDFVFSASNKFKINFLCSYINGDGAPDAEYGRKIRIKTASEKLASDVIYLCSQLEICAKFDHIEIGKDRKIAGNKKITKETRSYVVRIQNKDSLIKLKNSLCSRFDKLFTKQNWSQKYPPETLPINELNLDEIIPKKNTNLAYYINNLKNKKHIKTEHVSSEIISRDSIDVSGVTKLILNGDLSFDPITEIKESEYSGYVYDFEVPGVQNFLGGFGGILLHNSGHGSRDDIKEFIKMTKPKIVFPSQGEEEQLTAALKICEELGYEKNKTVKLLKNGERIRLL